jgi:5-aminolevulinate synthase
MGRHSLVVETLASSARRHGTGAGGTRNIAGNSHAVVEPEAEIADLYPKILRSCLFVRLCRQ